MSDGANVKQMYKDAFQRFAKGDVEGAIAGYHEIIGLDPGFSLAYQALAEAHARSGDLESAIDAIRKAIDAEPGESLYHTSLSRFLQRLGRIPEAEEAAMNAARIQSQGA